jgi:hypothetical protein
MQAQYQRQLKSGQQYNGMFPMANVATSTVRKNADVQHTVAFIPQVVKSTLSHTSAISTTLLGNTITDTCSNIWHFVYQHIAYKKDQAGYEQIRSPARTWHDRFTGVDCDCYTTFISSILNNLQIPHTYRITKYGKPHFQHIYPIVPMGKGKYITLDCVVDRFNYEEPYTEKQDTIMELQYLDGIDGDEILFAENTEREMALLGNDDTYLEGDLGRARFSIGKVLQKTVHAINKVNPATLLLRNGVLASMKLNIFQVAQKLKWAYLSDADAARKKIDTAKFAKLKAIRAKLETIFYGAGGQPENLKKAILRGKGNRGHEVSGLGNINEDTPLNELLGYDYETVDGLGEPATATAIASASAVIGALATLLKSIGNIFPNKAEDGASDFAENAAGEKSTTSLTTIAETNTVAPSLTADGKPNPNSNVAPSTNENGNAENALRLPDNPDGAETKTPLEAAGMWEKNKKWLKPTLIGVGGAGLLFLGYKAISSSSKAGATKPRAKPMNGVKRRKPQTRKKKITKQNLFN